MTIENAFDLEEVVYVKTDKEQLPRLIVGMWVTKGDIKYQVSVNNTTNYFYDFELSKEKDFLNNKKPVGFGK